MSLLSVYKKKTSASNKWSRYEMIACLMWSISGDKLSTQVPPFFTFETNFVENIIFLYEHSFFFSVTETVSRIGYMGGW